MPIGNTNVLTVRLKKAVCEKMRTEAKEKGLTISELIRRKLKK